MTIPLRSPAVLMLAMILLFGCSSPVRQYAVRFGDQPQQSIPGLSTCSDETGAALHIDPAQPLVLLVHGCRASAGHFRTLAQVFEAHGQRTACFTYEDRDSLDESSRQLLVALERLSAHMQARELTILGHSQGGLVSRRALIRERQDGVLQSNGMSVRLVTVSSPFHGIAASKHCGSLPFHILTFGVSAGICQLAAGDKWMEIHPASWPVKQPGTLVSGVTGFLKVVTDERDTCFRRRPDGRCAESDYVFSIEEQNNALIDQDSRVSSAMLAEGHSSVVGQHGLPPLKLIGLLQSKGVMAKTPADKRAAMERLLAALYGRSATGL